MRYELASAIVRLRGTMDNWTNRHRVLPEEAGIAQSRMGVAWRGKSGISCGMASNVHMNRTRLLRQLAALLALLLAATGLAQQPKNLEEAVSYDGLQRVSVKGIDMAYALPGATLSGCLRRVCRRVAKRSEEEAALLSLRQLIAQPTSRVGGRRDCQSRVGEVKFNSNAKLAENLADFRCEAEAAHFAGEDRHEQADLAPFGSDSTQCLRVRSKKPSGAQGERPAQSLDCRRL